MNLPVLAQDKANHLIYGLLVFTLALIFFGVVVACCATVVVAAGKELFDLAHRSSHTPDPVDLLVTVLGGALGLVNYLAAEAAR